MASEFFSTNGNTIRHNQANNAVFSTAKQANTDAESGNIRPIKGPDLPEKTSKARQVSQDDLEQIAKTLNKLVQSRQHRLQFSLDTDSGRSVIKVINKDTDEIIRQFPPEEILSLSRMITENLESITDDGVGLLFETQG